MGGLSGLGEEAATTHPQCWAAAVPRLSDLSVKIRGFGRVQSSQLRSHKYLFVSMVELFYTNFNKN